MKVLESTIEGVRLYGMDSPEFEPALLELVGRAPLPLLRPAVPYSVIIENNSDRPVALLGIRFDMTAQKGKQVSVVHYADSLRNPEKADFRPGTKRFICAEPAYTSLVIRGEVVPNTRGRMNLDNLKRMLHIKASLDCAAFDDGRFLGPDSQNALARFARERESELALLEQARQIAAEPIATIEALLFEAVQDSADRGRRTASRKLIEGLEAGGRDELMARINAYRCRIALSR